MICRRGGSTKGDATQLPYVSCHWHYGVSAQWGKLEIGQQTANHESTRTTGLYDRRNDQLSLDEVERILI